MLPQVLVFGKQASDVTTTVFFAALVLPLMFAILRRLSQLGLSRRSSQEDLLLTITLAFGSVFYFAAVQGRVWYTAHVVGVVLCLCYVWCSIAARRPFWAGLCLALAALTRIPMAFMFPLFVLEAWRIHRHHKNVLLQSWLLFALPIATIAGFAMLYNHARFDQVFEFGHSYLAVRQQQHVEVSGLFNLSYLLRNLRVALTLLPSVSLTAPYVTISGHGVALWFTTPLLLLILVPRRLTPPGREFSRALWLTICAVAVPTLLYQNTGWFQFGYRFSLDYLVFLLLLLAISGRSLTSALAKGLVVTGIIVNTFGAITFARYHGYYRGDTATYQTIIHE